MSHNRRIREEKRPPHQRTASQPDRQDEDGIFAEETLLPEIAHRARMHPAILSPGAVLHLQRTTGNQATIQLLRGRQKAAALPPSITQKTPSDRTVQRRRSRQFRAMSGHEQIVAGLLAQSIPNHKVAKGIYQANNRLLTNAEVAYFEALSESAEGKAWLHKKKFMDTDQVEAYGNGHDFTGWQTLKPPKKLQVATYQYNNNKTNTPGYWKGLSVNGRTAAIYEQDRQKWENTLQLPEEDADVWQESPRDRDQMANALNIVKRIFVVLQYGLQYNTDNADWEDLEDWEQPVAAVLGHGGRVNIRLPQINPRTNPHQFIDWLMGAGVRTSQQTRQQSGVTTRASSTHSVAIGKNVRGQGGNREAGTGSFRETSSSLGYFRGITHFGINLPIGGMGQLDINNRVILPDGRYGHLYIGYIPPTTQKDGAVLIGLESDEHGAPGPSPIGHVHTITAKQSEFTPTGGTKQDKVGIGKVDLTQKGDEWMNFLRILEREVDQGRITSRQLVGERLGWLR